MRSLALSSASSTALATRMAMALWWRKDTSRFVGLTFTSTCSGGSVSLRRQNGLQCLPRIVDVLACTASIEH